MKKLNLFFIFFTLFFFSDENITYFRDTNPCSDIQTSITYLKDNGYIPESIYYDGYGINADNCARHETSDDDLTCCYMSYSYSKQWYHLCGVVNLTKYEKKDDFITKFKELELSDDIQNFIKEKNIEIQIDCFSTKINFLKYYGLLILAFLL